MSLKYLMSLCCISCLISVNCSNFECGGKHQVMAPVAMNNGDMPEAPAAPSAAVDTTAVVEASTSLTIDPIVTSGSITTAAGVAPPPGRTMALHSLLNDSTDDIVDGSQPQEEEKQETKHEEEPQQRLSLTGTVLAVDASMGRGPDPSTVAILLSLQHSPVPQLTDEIRLRSGGLEKASPAMREGEQPPQKATVADAVLVATEGENAETREETPQTRSGRPIRSTRSSNRAKAHTQSIDAIIEAAVAGGPDNAPAQLEGHDQAGVVDGEDEDLDNKRRTKRRPPPRQARVALAKKTKTTAAPTPTPTPTPTPSARPRRAAQTRATLTDVTMLDDDDEEEGDEDADTELIIANHAAKTSRLVTPALAQPAAASAKTSGGSKSRKRPGISERQLAELMNDNRKTGPLSNEELAGLSSKYKAANQGTGIDTCEFCRLRHTAHTLFSCRNCKRMYHGKCFVQAYHSQVNPERPLEAQMEDLRLWRPPNSKSSVLRCASCSAAFLELSKYRSILWDCQCETCTAAPEMASDYRRVTIKQVIDEHNEFLAKAKAEAEAKKAAAAAKKPAAAAKTTKKKSTAMPQEPVAAPPPEPEPAAQAPAPTRGNRRTRAREKAKKEQQPVAEAAEVKDVPMTEAPVDTEGVPAPLSTPTPRRANRPSPPPKKAPRGKASTNTKQVSAEPLKMDIVQDLGTPPDPRRGRTGSASLEEPHLLASLTAEQLDERFGITHGNDKTLSFRIACTPSIDRTQSGNYKEATFVWHPTRTGIALCACCGDLQMPLRRFVDHTDASLLATAGEGDGTVDLYQFLFAVEKSQELVPLHRLTMVLRARHGPGVRASDTKRGRGKGGSGAVSSVASVGAGSAPPSPASVIGELKDVVYSPRRTDKPAVRGARTQPEFECEVACVQTKYLRPKQFSEAVFSLQLDSVSSDIYKLGMLEVVANPNMRNQRFRCHCCQAVFNTTKFTDHTAESILTMRDETKKDAERQLHERQQQRHNLVAPPKQKGDGKDGVQASDHDDYDDLDRERRLEQLDKEIEDLEKELKEMQQPIKHSVVVRQRDQITVLSVEAFSIALSQLGNQAEVNQAVTAIVEAQSKPVTL